MTIVQTFLLEIPIQYLLGWKSEIPLVLNLHKRLQDTVSENSDLRPLRLTSTPTRFSFLNVPDNRLITLLN